MSKQSRKVKKAATAAKSAQRRHAQAVHAASKVTPLPEVLTADQVDRAGTIIDRIVRDTCAQEGRPIAQACMMYAYIGKDALATLYGATFDLIGGSLELRTGKDTVINGQPAMDNIGFISRNFSTPQAAFASGAFHLWLVRQVAGGFELLDFSARQWPHLFTASGDAQPFAYPDTIHVIRSSAKSDAIEELKTHGFVHMAERAITVMGRDYYEQGNDADAQRDLADKVRLVAHALDTGLELVSLSDVLPVKTVDENRGRVV